MVNEHTDDLRNVRQGDSVEITTSDGVEFGGECVSRTVEHSQNPELVRQFYTWEFNAPFGPIFVQITEGLRESDDMEQFPWHSEAWVSEKEESIGYITDVKIHGDMS